jgi:hypothetical protein
VGEVLVIVAEAECVHHWRIDEVNGRYSNGRCKKCGVEKLHDNRSRADLTGPEAREAWRSGLTIKKGKKR